MRVGAGIFVSRVLGLVRERVFAHYFGSGDVADAWRAALRLPNVIRNLLGEGTLSASVIPVYAELVAEGRDEDARRFAGAILGIVVVIASSVAMAGMAVAPWLIELVFPLWAPDKQELTVRLVRILFPMVGLFVLSAWAMSVLDTHRRFFVSYVAPAMWNVATISAMAGGAIYLGGVAAGPAQVELVVILAWGALAGGALQLGLQLPFALRMLGGTRLSLGRGVEGVGEAIRNFAPVVAARGVVNISGWFEVYLAGLLATGAVAILGYAQMFYLLPISLFGISVAASELPELSRMRAEHKETLALRVSTALRRVAFFLIPSAVGYLALGDVVVAALLQTGAFDDAQTLVTWGVLAAFTLGLPATASSRVLSSAFYALRDTRTPARMAWLRVAVSLAAGVALMGPLDRYGFGTVRLGAAGLALGSSLAAWLEYVLLRQRLAREIGGHGPGPQPVLRMTAAALAAAAAGMALQVFVPVSHPWAVALVSLVPFVAVYFVVADRLGESFTLGRAANG